MFSFGPGYWLDGFDGNLLPRNGARTVKVLLARRDEKGSDMQRFQRQRHRFIWIVIGLLTIIIFLYGILNRPEWPIDGRIPEAGGAEGQG